MATPLKLVVIDSLGRRLVPVEKGPFAIGRGSDNQLQLPDTRVSRKHAELVEDGDRWRIRDCGSRFGTFVNEQKVDDCEIKAGDSIRLGQTELKYDGGDTVTGASSTFDFRQVNALLAGLRALGSTQVLDEVLAIVLDSALELTGAERGFMLLSEEGGGLSQKLARARGGVTLTKAQTSTRIPEEVFQTGSDKIVTDLLDDSHAKVHAGTVALGIRHVLCTPLKVIHFGQGGGGEKRIGVLYLDSRERGYLQTVGALHALAAEAAVVIENARLYQEVVAKERVAQEMRIAAQMQRNCCRRLTMELAELAAITTCRDVGGPLRLRRVPTACYRCRRGRCRQERHPRCRQSSSLAAQIRRPFRCDLRVNHDLCRRPSPRCVTAFMSAERGALRYCNAGHNPPFLVSANGVSRLETGGTVLGLFDTSPFDTGEERVKAGDLLVLFSDGVTEAENLEGEEFGDDRLEACFKGLRERSATEIMDVVQQGLSAFCGTAAARDDVTVMIVKVR